jgi:hypothetical protein
MGFSSCIVKFFPENGQNFHCSNDATTHISGAHHKSEKCRNYTLGAPVLESENTVGNKCDTPYKRDCELGQMPSCDMEDCEPASCESLGASINTGPSHVKTELVSKAVTGE